MAKCVPAVEILTEEENRDVVWAAIERNQIAVVEGIARLKDECGWLIIFHWSEPIEKAIELRNWLEQELGLNTALKNIVF